VSLKIGRQYWGEIQVMFAGKIQASASITTRRGRELTKLFKILSSDDGRKGKPARSKSSSTKPRFLLTLKCTNKEIEILRKECY